MEPPSLNKTRNELEQLANKFSPIYVLSKDEKYYPCNLSNILPWCSLRKAKYTTTTPPPPQTPPPPYYPYMWAIIGLYVVTVDWQQYLPPIEQYPTANLDSVLRVVVPEGQGSFPFYRGPPCILTQRIWDNDCKGPGCPNDGPQVYLVVDYGLVDETSEYPVLTSFGTPRWPDGVNTCTGKDFTPGRGIPGSGRITRIGWGEPAGAITGQNGTKRGCNYYGGCVTYEPINTCGSYIKSIMIQTFTDDRQYPDLSKTIKFPDRYPKIYKFDVCETGQDIHGNCGDGLSMYVLNAMADVNKPPPPQPPYDPTPIKTLEGWQTIIPAGFLTQEILFGDENAINKLGENGIYLEPEDIKVLKVKNYTGGIFQVANKNYGLVFESPDASNDFSKIVDNQYTVISRLAGDLNNPDFDPRYKTWYHNGAVGCPGLWKTPKLDCSEYAKTILERNSKIKWDPNPQFTFMQQKPIYKNGKFKYWVTDFSYITTLAFNGTPSLLSGAFSHFIDIEVSGVRFLSSDVKDNGMNAKPLRFFMSTHGGYSWFEPGKIIFNKLNLNYKRSGDNGEATHPTIYWGRESHEDYRSSTPVNRLFGVGNDQLSGGVIWQPKALFVDILQDKSSHETRVSAFKEYKLSDYYETYIFPDGFFTSQEYSELRNNLWLFVSPRVTINGGQTLSMISEKVRLREGQCVGEEDTDNCIAKAACPAAGMAEYTAPGVADPLGDYEEFDSKDVLFKPIPSDCLKSWPSLGGGWNGNEECCKNSLGKPSPTHVLAIVNITATRDRYFYYANKDWTPIQINKPTTPWLGYKNTNLKTSTGEIIKLIRPSGPGPNINTMDFTTIFVKYEYVDPNSSTPVLVDLEVGDWEVSCNPITNIKDCKTGYKWGDPSCKAGWTPDGRLTMGSTVGCNRVGLCKLLKPINTVDKFITSVVIAWTFEEGYRPQYASLDHPLYYSQPTNTIYTSHIPVTTYDFRQIQGGCPNKNYVYLGWGFGNKLTKLNKIKSIENYIPDINKPPPGIFVENPYLIPDIRPGQKWPSGEGVCPESVLVTHRCTSTGIDISLINNGGIKCVNNSGTGGFSDCLNAPGSYQSIEPESKYSNCNLNCSGRCYGDGTCCVPNCDGKKCGDDGCGGNCGSCAYGEDCNTENGTCSVGSTIPQYLNFNSGYGKVIQENVNKILMPFILTNLSKSKEFNIDKDNGNIKANIKIASLENKNIYLSGNAHIENIDAELKLASDWLKYIGFPGEKTLIIKDIGNIKAYIFDIYNIDGFINGLKIKVTANDTNIDTHGSITIEITTDPIDIMMNGKLSNKNPGAGALMDNNFSSSIKFPNGLKIKLKANLKLPSTKQYRGGTVQDIYFAYPTNNKMCDSTDPKFKSFYGTYDPCIDNIDANARSWGKITEYYSNPLKTVKVKPTVVKFIIEFNALNKHDIYAINAYSPQKPSVTFLKEDTIRGDKTRNYNIDNVLKKIFINFGIVGIPKGNIQIGDNIKDLPKDPGTVNGTTPPPVKISCEVENNEDLNILNSQITLGRVLTIEFEYKSYSNIQALGQHYKPEGIFSIPEYLNNIGFPTTAIELLDTNLQEINISFKCWGSNDFYGISVPNVGTGLCAVVNAVAGQLGGVIGDAVKDVIKDGIKNIALNDPLFVYPVL